MTRYREIVLCLLLFLLLSACGNSRERAMSKEAIAGSAKKLSPSRATDAQQSAEPRQADEVKEDFDRKIIREGDLHFETSDLAATDQAIKEVCAKLGAQVHNDYLSKGTGRVNQTMTLKIPSAKFDELVVAVSAIANRLDSKNIRLQDVTEEFVDINARLEVRRQLEGRYVALLEKAGTIKELIEVEKELRSIREEIESTEGRLKYLTSRSSISTLNVHFYQSKAGYFGFFGKMRRAFSTGWYTFLDVLVALAHGWPFILIGLAVAWLIFWRRKNISKPTGKK